MSQKTNKYQFRTKLLHEVKVSPARAYLYLFLGLFKRLRIKFAHIAFLLVAAIGLTTIVMPQTAFAGPTDSKAECEAAGGTWTMVALERCVGYTGGGNVGTGITKEACEAAGKQWVPLAIGNLRCVDKAPASKASKMSLADQALSYAYVNSLALCVRDSRFQLNGSSFGWQHDQISNGQVLSGDWFKTNTSWNAGDTHPHHAAASFLSPGVNKSDDKGKTMCNDILKQASTLWGYPFWKSSGNSILCDFVEKRKNGSSCETGTDVFIDIHTHWEKLVSSVKSFVYNGTAPAIKNEHRYVLFREAFMKGCSPKESTTAASEFKYVVKIVQDDGTFKDKDGTTYEGAKHDTKRFAYTSNSYEQLEYTCKQIADKMNEFADAYASYRQNHQDEPTTPSGSVDPDAPASEDQSSCRVEGVGWMLCPLVNFLAGVTDAAYSGVELLLKVPPMMMTGSSSQSVYVAWQAMRSIANVMFVIAFLIIIFSQVSSLGVSNYGVKKTLPRLIIGAVLVNMSFWICAVAVDLSNIIGSGMVGFFKSIGAGLELPTAASTGDWGGVATGEGWLGIVGAIISGGAIVASLVYLGLSALLPFLLAVALVIFFVFLILTLRQALIILLVVIAPLAFAAYLLPNTEGWFHKWRKLLVTLLLMYPIIGILFGASALAAQVVMNSSDNIFVQMAGSAMSSIPLVLTVTILKSTGGVLNRVGAWVNNPNRGPIDKMRKRATSFREHRQSMREGNALTGNRRVFGAGQFKRGARRKLRNQASSSYADVGEQAFALTDNTAAAYTSQISTNKLASAAAAATQSANTTSTIAANGGSGISAALGGAAAGATAGAVAAQVTRAIEEEIKNVKLSADFAPGALDEIGAAYKKAVKEGDSVKARAYQDMLMTSGGPGLKEWRGAVSDMEKDASASGITQQMSNTLRNHAMQSNPGLKGADAAAAKWATDSKGGSLESITRNKDTWSGLSNEELMGQKKDAITDAVKSGAIGKQRAAEMAESESFNKMAEDIKVEIRKIAAGP